MRKRKRRSSLTPEQRAEQEAQFAHTDKHLRERIEYHRARMIAERPGWDHPKTEEEWAAYNEAYIRRRIGLDR
jgi:hypothetical protein